MRRKRSAIWKIDTEQLEEVVSKSQNLSQVLRFFGLSHKGGNSKTLKLRLDQEDIPYKHFIGNRVCIGVPRKGRKPLSEITVENSSYSRTHLKKRLLDEGVLEEVCAICSLPPVWTGKKLVLILDHVNGIGNDHRIENLRLLCPNCNSQTETFCGRRKRY